MDTFSKMTPIEGIETVAQALALHVRRAKAFVVLTGAGMSTECGIPDFRSPGSPWLDNPPMPFDRFLASKDARREAWRRKFRLDDHHKGAAPGVGHRLARLVNEGFVEMVITQNIDNMHQAAGIPADKVIELHGNGTYARCLDCGRRHELAFCRRMLEEENRAPCCEACGGIVKAATISLAGRCRKRRCERCLAPAGTPISLLAIGSSLLVYPAAGLPLVARDNGAVFLISQSRRDRA